MEVDISKLHDTKCVLQSMLEINGYITDEPNFKEMKLEDFKEYLENREELDDFLASNDIVKTTRNSLSGIYKHKNGTKIFVYFYDNNSKTAQVGSDAIKKFISATVASGSNKGIIICDSELSHPAESKIYQSNSGVDTRYDEQKTYSFTFIDDRRFLDLTENCLCPEVVKIFRGKEVEEFCAKNNISSSVFPKLVNTDPISIFYLLKPGDIIQFKRKIGNSDSVLTYEYGFRIVISRVKESSESKGSKKN